MEKIKEGGKDIIENMENMRIKTEKKIKSIMDTYYDTHADFGSYMYFSRKKDMCASRSWNFFIHVYF